jgi:hypothetical protein
MKEISYRGYTIIGTARNQQGMWEPHVRISGPVGKRIVDVHESTSLGTEEEAEEIALRVGKHWVNNRLLVRQLRSDYFKKFR